jgi:hypothetical protein
MRLVPVGTVCPNRWHIIRDIVCSVVCARCVTRHVTRRDRPARILVLDMRQDALDRLDAAFVQVVIGHLHLAEARVHMHVLAHGLLETADYLPGDLIAGIIMPMGLALMERAHEDRLALVVEHKVAVLVIGIAPIRVRVNATLVKGACEVSLLVVARLVMLVRVELVKLAHKHARLDDARVIVRVSHTLLERADELAIVIAAGIVHMRECPLRMAVQHANDSRRRDAIAREHHGDNQDDACRGDDQDLAPCPLLRIQAHQITYTFPQSHDSVTPSPAVIDIIPISTCAYHIEGNKTHAREPIDDIRHP